jgi:hypothetical protein
MWLAVVTEKIEGSAISFTIATKNNQTHPSTWQKIYIWGLGTI